MTFTIVNPPTLPAPRGWNHGMLAPAGGRLLFVAGMIGLEPNAWSAGADPKAAAMGSSATAAAMGAGGAGLPPVAPASERNPLPNGTAEELADTFVAQFERALGNILEVVREAGGEAEHIGRMTIYVITMETYRASLQRLGAVWRSKLGRHYPAMALVEVRSLVDHGALLEIEATCVIPSRP